MTSDPKLSKLYQQSQKPEPHASLDDAILATARKEVEAPQHQPAKQHWHVPVALAAVVVLSVLVVPLMQQEEAIQHSQEQFQEQFSEEADSVELESISEDAMTSGAAAPIAPMRQRKAKPANAVRSLSAPSSEMKSLNKSRPSLMMKRDSVQESAAPFAMQKLKALPTDELTRIKELLASGQHDAARIQLQKFRNQNPGHPIPPELLNALK